MDFNIRTPSDGPQPKKEPPKFHNHAPIVGLLSSLPPPPRFKVSFLLSEVQARFFVETKFFVVFLCRQPQEWKSQQVAHQKDLGTSSQAQSGLARPRPKQHLLQRIRQGLEWHPNNGKQRAHLCISRACLSKELKPVQENSKTLGCG